MLLCHHFGRYVATIQCKAKRVWTNGQGAIKDSYFWMFNFFIHKEWQLLYHNIAISCCNMGIRIETKNIAIQCCISVLLQHYFPLLSVSSPVLIYHFPFQFFSALGPTAVHCPCPCLFPPSLAFLVLHHVFPLFTVSRPLVYTSWKWLCRVDELLSLQAFSLTELEFLKYQYWTTACKFTRVLFFFLVVQMKRGKKRYMTTSGSWISLSSHRQTWRLKGKRKRGSYVQHLTFYYSWTPRSRPPKTSRQGGHLRELEPYWIKIFH